MGNTCSCITGKYEKSEVQLDSNRMRQISNTILILATKLRTDLKLYTTLIRIQSKVRGLITRGKVKNSNQGNKKFMPYHDPEAPFKPVTFQKIVKKI